MHTGVGLHTGRYALLCRRFVSSYLTITTRTRISWNVNFLWCNSGKTGRKREFTHNLIHHNHIKTTTLA